VLDISDNPFPDLFPELKLPRGSLTLDDERTLLKYSRGTVVDLGTFMGRSAAILSLKAEKVFTIDRFIHRAEFADYNYNKVCANLAPFLISVLRGQKNRVALRFADEGADVLFIDANHSYDFVKRDFLSWLPKVKKGGCILFHDYVDLWPDVQKFVNELKEGKELEHIEDSGWISVFKKN